MPGPEQDALERRYAEILGEICVSLEQGRPPWWNQTARLGPAMLGRSGQSLRGLPAVIAWHVGEKWPRRPLSWRLWPPSRVDVSSAAVFRLAANGGDALYAATPDRRPQEIQDSPTSVHTDYWPMDRLDEQLGKILKNLDTMAPDLDADRPVIVSLTQAFIRPLGDTREPTLMEFRGPWPPQRLARVAAWARLVADDVMLDVFRPRRSYYVPAPRWHYSHWWSSLNERMANQDLLIQLSRAGWLQHSLPAEVRQRYEARTQADDTASDWRYVVPEQPLRLGLFYSQRQRSPALRILGAARHMALREPVSQRLPWAMDMMGWRDKAALGLALAESLEHGPLVSEPGMAWRLIGRHARTAMQRRTNPASLENALATSDVKGFWDELRDHLAVRTWFHPTTRAPLKNLVSSERWTRDDLDELLRNQGLAGWSEGGSEYPASQLPVVRVATLRRPKKQRRHDEPSVLATIAHALRCASYWPAVIDAAGQATWERQKRPKRSGGIRWLDVPCDELRAAQRVVSDVLLAVAPSTGSATAFHAGASPALHARAHAGAAAAVRMDLADFFGSVRPWHLQPWLGLGQGQDCNLLPGWSREGRQALMVLLFHRRNGNYPYLPQGAPSSPAAANLAGAWLDHAIIRRAAEVFGPGRFSYTRYADDMVLSTREHLSVEHFTEQARLSILDAVDSQKWRVQHHKTRVWTYKDGEPLHICDIRVPRDASQALTLGRDTWRRARAALHRMRHRLDVDTLGSPNAAHGLLAYAYSATADLRWLTYTSRRLQTFARYFAGPLFSENFLAGWSDAE